MNKLDVALKLLQLLNERKTVDSKTVAHELNVSIRTAQRYLVELSILPCVTTKQNEHSYTLNPDYRLNGALSNGTPPSATARLSKEKGAQPEGIPGALCLLCGSSRTPSKGGRYHRRPPPLQQPRQNQPARGHHLEAAQEQQMPLPVELPNPA
jgi:hypothetical protein